MLSIRDWGPVCHATCCCRLLELLKRELAANHRGVARRYPGLLLLWWLWCWVLLLLLGGRRLHEAALDITWAGLVVATHWGLRLLLLLLLVHGHTSCCNAAQTTCALCSLGRYEHCQWVASSSCTTRHLPPLLLLLLL